MPSIMRRFMFTKLEKSPSKETVSEKSRKDRGNSLSTKSSVNEEYLKAFRSKSYEEIWDKVHGQLGLGLVSSSNNISAVSSSSSSSLSSPFYLDLSEYLLEPRQETLKSMIESLGFHRLLVDYFEASLRACNICELLLRSINQARVDYRKIKRVIKVSERVLLGFHQDHDHDHHHHKHYRRATFRELKAIALLKNPLSVISPLQFRDIRDGYVALFGRLTSKGKRVRTRERAGRILKRAGGFGLVIAHNALLIALLIFAFHSVLGIIAAPTLIGCSSINHVRKKKEKKERKFAGGEQFAAAAKGVFILINDFDTMCQMVRRLHDEIEHRRSVAEICVRNNGKFEVLREVVKELSEQECGFVEQLEELEGHIYLCLLTINRSRRLVIQEIIANCHN